MFFEGLSGFWSHDAETLKDGEKRQPRYSRTAKTSPAASHRDPMIRPSRSIAFGAARHRPVTSCVAHVDATPTPARINILSRIGVVYQKLTGRLSWPSTQAARRRAE